jgi:Fe-S cluster biosynthesis and repair protein YggX
LNININSIHFKFINIINKLYVSRKFKLYLKKIINCYGYKTLNPTEIIDYLSQDNFDNNSDIYKYICNMFINYEYNKIVKKDLTSFNECYKLAIEKVDNIIICIKLNKEAEGLAFAPVPGELGKKIWQQVSKEAWADWLKHQTMLINENRLNMADARARQYLLKQTEQYQVYISLLTLL